MLAFRIADARHPIYSPAGAMLKGGRWNSPGLPVIYAAETFAGSLLEVLAHLTLSRIPLTHKVVTIHIPDEVSLESVRPEDLPGWNSSDTSVPQAFGDRWTREARTAVLRVPGIVTGGREDNLILNPGHPQFALISASPAEPVYWEPRLFNPR